MTKMPIIVAIALLVPAGALAQGEGTPPPAAGQAGQPQGQAGQPGQAEAQPVTIQGFEVEGEFDVGFRWRDVDGSRTKYREDINLQNGPRLFNLHLNVTPVGTRFFDRLTVNADGLGGDPFETIAISLQKFGQFEFKYRRDEAEYFYRDLLRDPALTTPALSNAGDFHTFDFRRANDTFDLEVNLTPSLRTFAHLNRFARVGESTTTFDIARDEFEFDAPLDQRKYDVTVGAQYALENVTFYFDETYRDWETEGRTFLPGASVGENPTNATELFFFQQIAPYGFEMAQSTGKVDVRPTERLGISGTVRYASFDGNLDFQEQYRGINFNAAPLQSFTTGQAGMDRTTKLFDLDVEYEVNDYVTVMGGARASRFDQTARFDETGAPGADTRYEIASDLFSVSARVYPTRQLALTGGLRLEERETTTIVDEFESQAPSTDRTTFFVTASYEPLRRLNLLAEYERGDYDNPFTLIAPTTQDRAKARIRYRPIDGLSLVGSLLARRIDNSISGAQIDLTDFTASAAYERQRASLLASYSRRQVDNEVINTVFFGANPSLFQALYESTVDMGTLDFSYRVHERVRPGVGFVVYNNDGTFPLEWRQYQAFVEFTAGRGHTIRLHYRHNDFDELAFGFESYSANIVTISTGYRF